MLTGRMLSLAAVFALVVVASALPAPKSATSANAQQPMSPNSLTLYAQQDAWVDQETPTTNYGRGTVMTVGRFTGETSLARQSLVQFDLSPLPADAIVMTATLELYQVQASGAGDYIVYPDANFGSWVERDVNWDTKPPSDNIGDLPVYLSNVDGWKSWSITNMVRGWFTKGGIENFGVQLRGDSDTVGMRGFASREDEKFQPILVVEYVLPPPPCVEILSHLEIPSPGLINFDDLSGAAPIGTSYQLSHGVTFENNLVTRALISGNEPILETRSPPNVAVNYAEFPNTSANVPMRIFFDSTKTHVGFWIGNGETEGPAGVLTAYDADSSPICTVSNSPVPESHAEFIGIFDQYSRIASVALDYGSTLLSESLDDLYFAPVVGESVLPVISNVRPTGWVITTQSPTVYASVIDAGSGISVTSASYRYSKDGAFNWFGPFPATVSGANGVTSTQTMTATNVLFNQDSVTLNRIEFRIADMNGNVGTTQGTILIDATPPTAPTSLTSSHSLTNWSSDNTVDLNWSGAVDATSGLNGYSWSFAQSTDGIPDDLLDTSGSSATSPPLTDAGNWYASVRARDFAGHWSADVKRTGPFRIDTTPPTNPNAVSSTSHSPFVWSNNSMITMIWSGTTDNGSFVDGYSFSWDTFPATPPDTAADGWSETTTSPSMSSGNNKYFHLRTRDGAGNWSPTAVNRGPYYVDTLAPSSVASSPASSASLTFLVSWPGTDAHSGVASYDIQYRNVTSGGIWTDWFLGNAGTSSTFLGQRGYTYEFRSRARDTAGNVEAYPASADTQTRVANIDIWARNPGLEVNQAVQDLNNSVVLIAGKRTFVRAYVQSDVSLVEAVPARLTVQRGATIMGALSPANPGATINVLSNPSRAERDQSYYFDVPTGWLDPGTVTFSFEVNPSPRKYAEDDYADNTRSATVNFVRSPTMNLRIIDMPYLYNNVVHYPRTIDRLLLASWLRRAYPINTLNVIWDSALPYIGAPEPILVNIGLSMDKWRRILFTFEDPHMRYYGMVSDGGSFMRGMSFGSPINVAAGPAGTPKSTPLGSDTWDFDASYADWYGGHELGHAYDRGHVWVDDTDPECWAVGWPIGLFPNPQGDISPTREEWSNSAIFGLDAVGPTVIPPSWNDMMTYCMREWISDFNYRAIYNRMVLEKPFLAPQIQAVRATAGEHLVVMGSVITATNTITLSDFYRVPDGFDVFGRDASGQYHIRLLGNNDTVLADYPFALRLGSDREEAVGLITEMVPWITGTRKVVILDGATALAQRNVSANAPTVAITVPNGGETLSGSTVNVIWTANDADGDALSYSLDYSRDGGVTWEPKSSNITTTQITLDLNLLPGTTQGRFRVWASDGVNTTLDTSDGNFTTVSKLPTILSIAPASGQTYVVSQTVALEGQAFDAEDGLLPDSKLEWSSNLMGTLGTGTLLQTTDLVTGTHTITIRATDSNGNFAQATTTIVVTDEPTTTGTIYQVFLPIVLRGP